MHFARAALTVSALLALAACAGYRPPPAAPPSHAPEWRPPAFVPHALPHIRFSIQVGAFANPDNAIRLKESIEGLGVDAFHYTGSDGLFRVRFGDFAERASAVEQAEALKLEGVIGDYFVVSPETYGFALGGGALRVQVVSAATSFLGWPYRWGGPSPETGFDCSGLTMTAYRLNGIALPRTAAEQYAAGESVAAEGLKEADLVFFAMESRHKPTHVGLYVGEGRFIHAPGSGKVVRVDELSSDYYRQRFLGGRSYLP